MKEKFLQSLSKAQLRTIAKNLNTPKADKLSKEKILSKLLTHSYMSLKDALTE